MQNDQDSFISRTPTPTNRRSLRRSVMDPSEYHSLTLDNADSTTHLLVGSPDQIPYTSPSRSSAHDIGDGATTRRPPRPTMGKRSTSSTFTVRQRVTSAQPGPSSVTSRPAFNLASPPDHQWTLFGQVMENEVPFVDPRTAASTPSGQRPRTALVTSPQSSMVLGDSGRFEVPYLHSSESSSLSRRSSRPTSPLQRNAEDDTAYDSDTSTASGDSDSEEDIPGTPTHTPPSWWKRIPQIPQLYRNILKCSLSYFIASLFTYTPALSHLIGSIASYGPGSTKPSPSAHLVASIAVYYNPAKTMGGMIEADLFCALGVLYAAFVSVASMSLYWWLELSPGWEWLGDVIAIIWVGLSMSAIAWAKVWMANPSFNTACSMMVILISTVVVKEGGLHMLLQVAAIVGFGSLISNVVCYLIWPQTAIQNLQNNMSKTLDSFSTVLNMLTKTFLLEGGAHSKAQLEKIQRAVENHQSSFTSLKKSLVEARTEWVPRGDGPKSWANNSGKVAYEDAVDSLNRLGQHLNGLRSGTRLQYELTKAGMSRRQRRKGKRRELDEGIMESLSEEDEETAMLKAAADMFGDVVDELGPPLKALSSTCTSGLKRLQEAFELSKTGRKKGGFSAGEFVELMESIEIALVRFESTSNHAVLRWYRRSDNLTDSHQSIASVSTNRPDYTVNPLMTGNENEDIFLVYFFIFTLQEFAREMTSSIDAMRRIYTFEHERAHRERWWTRVFRSIFSKSTDTPNAKPREGLRRRLSAYMRGSGRHPVPAFPKVRPHAPDTLQTPSRNEMGRIGRMKQTLWTIGSRLNERDFKYALKAGMAMAILASPAFFDETRPIFVDYQGEWALISFFVVISPTIGATNNLSLQRIFCTLFGAAVAAGIYSLFPEDPVLLSIFGFFYSIPCFYLGLSRPEYGTASRFLLLTYNLTCLYCYNARDKDLSVLYVATHRAAAVTAGVVWAAIVSRVWWPTEARKELMHALTEFCLNTGWLYSRLVASNSFAPEYRREDGVDEPETEMTEPTTFQLTRLNNSIREFMAMELHLQIKLIELQGLLAQTVHEPRLKGPFPVLLYRGILTSLQTILDRLHSIRCVTTREEWYTSVRQDFIIPVNKERHEMVGNILLSFSVLASVFKLKTPLPPYLPPAEKARQRLVDAIRQLDVVRNREVKGSRQLLFFAYALAMKGVTEELESLGRTLQNAFGVIGNSAEDFEALFLPPEESHHRIADAV